jgi:hypothetical protein
MNLVALAHLDAIKTTVLEKSRVGGEHGQWGSMRVVITHF